MGMVAYPTSHATIQGSKVLSQVEIDAVLDDLNRKRSNPQNLLRLIIFRLATFTGLRVTEMTLLNLSDMHLTARPYISIRAETSKGHKAREVPIYSQATVADLVAWMNLRKSQGATASSPFLVSVSQDALGNRFSRQGCRNRFIAACKVLGDRADSVTIHHGRHTAASMALHKGVPVNVVRDFMGHSSISVTNAYSSVFFGHDSPVYNLDKR